MLTDDPGLALLASQGAWAEARWTETARQALLSAYRPAGLQAGYTLYRPAAPGTE